MRLVIIGSSSKGNCYLLQNDSETLIIECGVNIAEIKQAVSFTFKNVVGCLLTHEHGDHAKSAKELMRMGVDIYTSKGTARELDVPTDYHRIKIVSSYQRCIIGNFSIIPFKVNHDVAEPLGFIIYHVECGSVLFITDSFYVEDTFKNINNIIIETNFSEEIVKQRMLNGYLPDYRANRLFKSHMSLETCKKTLTKNDLSKVHNIVLIHLSDGNSNAEHFKSEIENLTGKKVYVADAGMVIENFNAKPF